MTDAFGHLKKNSGKHGENVRKSPLTDQLPQTKELHESASERLINWTFEARAELQVPRQPTQLAMDFLRLPIVTPKGWRRGLLLPQVRFHTPQWLAHSADTP